MDDPLTRTRCDAFPECDDDLACSLERFAPEHLVESTCTSLACLWRDVRDGHSVRQAVGRNDRYVYVLVAVVVVLALLFVAMPRRSASSPRLAYETRGRGVRGWQ